MARPSIIQYDLRKGDRDDYAELVGELENAGGVRSSRSTWLLMHEGTASGLAAWLRQFMHKKDVLGVNALGLDYSAGNPLPDADAWMRQYSKPTVPGKL